MKGREKNFNVKKAPQTRLPLSLNKLNKVKDNILGKNYELSLVFISPKKSREINKGYRGKDHSTNVLSFPLEEKVGEIFIDLKTAKKEYRDFQLSYKNFALYLFIHACLHLKGLDHGSKMKREEDKFMAKFSS